MKADLQAIIDLMEELKGKMSDGPDDMDERLGKPKGLEVLKIGMDSKPGMPGMDEGMDDEESSESPEDEMKEQMLGMGDSDDESPEEKLKNRLLKLRG
jgi:hypothetical protein